jgi:hypothetical protein
MKMVRCKVCSNIEGIDKLLVPTLDYFIKHSNLGKCNVATPGMVIGAYYANPNNAHVKIEKIYVSIWRDMIINLVEKVGKVEK